MMRPSYPTERHFAQRYFWTKLKELVYRRGVTPIFFDVTSGCNLRCSHCYFFKGPQRKTLSLPEWEAMFAKYKAQHYYHAVLSGGEPTLKPRVIELADRYFPILNIATNGLIKIPEKIQHTILISLDGQPETHDRIRGAGAFERMIANYQNDPRVIFRMTIHTMNIDEIEAVAETALRYNVRGLSFILYAHYLQVDPLSLSPTELETVRERILAIIKKYGSFIYLTPSMLEAMVHSSFVDSCRLRQSIALRSDGSPKNKCTMDNIDCNSCKCPTPALMHTYRTDPRTFLLSLKYY
jgi:MoaA/NifB/PqqE/SkfB family radical SAM enzyme